MEAKKQMETFDLTNNAQPASAGDGANRGAKEGIDRPVRRHTVLSGLTEVMVWVLVSLFSLAAWAWVFFHVAAFLEYLRHLIP